MSKSVYEFGLFREVQCQPEDYRWVQPGFSTGRFIEVGGKNYHRIPVGEPTFESIGVNRVRLNFPDLSNCSWTGIRGYVAAAVLLKDNIPIAVITHGAKMKPRDTLSL